MRGSTRIHCTTVTTGVTWGNALHDWLHDYCITVASLTASHPPVVHQSCNQSFNAFTHVRVVVHSRSKNVFTSRVRDMAGLER